MIQERIQTAIVGSGGMARWHIRTMLQQQDTTRIVVVCEPSPDAYSATVEVFEEAELEAPPNQPDLARQLDEYGDQLDAAFIATPHVCHHDQAWACLEAGLDVLLEKPMVMNANEARNLIDVRDRTGKLLVVAFPAASRPRFARRRICCAPASWAGSSASAPWCGRVGDPARSANGANSPRYRGAALCSTPAPIC